jgi:hypothetical protein
MATTDSSGDYNITDLESGTYQVNVTAGSLSGSFSNVATGTGNDFILTSSGGGGLPPGWDTDGADDHEIVVNVSFDEWTQYPILVAAWYGTSTDGDPSGYVLISEPGVAHIFVPHVEGQTSVMIGAVWWDNPDMNGDPVQYGFYETPIPITGAGPTEVGVTMSSGGGGMPPEWNTDGADDHEIVVNVTYEAWTEFPILVVAWYGTSTNSSPSGYVSLASPGTAHIYVPHAEGQSVVTIAALWWENADMNGDPAQMGVYPSSVSISGSGPTEIDVAIAGGGGSNTGLSAAYVDTASPGPVYALFGMDLTGVAAQIPDLAGNFSLLNSADASCGTASSASLMASFHDVSNMFIELGFTSVTCPESTNPAKLKFIDPENAEIFDIVSIQDVSEIGQQDPTVTFTNASNISQTSVDLNGSISSVGTKTITGRGFRIGTDLGYGTATLSEENLSGYSTGSYSLNASTLTCGTTYHLQAFVVDSNDVEYYSLDDTFATSACGDGLTYNVSVKTGTPENNNSVSNADVSVGAYTCSTGDNDNCSISNIPPGTYTISVNANFFAPYTEENVTVDLGNAYKNVYLTPNPVDTVSGTITDSTTAPIDGATVFSIVFNGNGSPPPPTTTSGGGHYSFSDLTEGSMHMVMAMKAGYVGNYTPMADLLASNDNTHFDLQLATATGSNSGSISGSLSVNSAPLSGKKVVVFTGNMSGGPWPEVAGSGTSETDSSGDFTISGLTPSDSYMVLFLQDFNNYEMIGSAGTSVTAGNTTTLDYNIITPEVTTSAATSVTTTSATFNGAIGHTYEINNVSYGGIDSLNEASFEYGTVASGTFGNQYGWPNMNYETGEMSGTVVNLQCSTEYQFRAYANSFAGTGYGETLTFTTSSCGGDAVTAAMAAGNLICEFVSGTWQSLSSLTQPMSASNYNSSSPTNPSGTIGNENAFILVANPTSTKPWTLSIAPTGGAGALWTDGASHYADFNDSYDGTDGADADNFGGRLTIDPSNASIQPYSPSYTVTDLAQGSSASFVEGTVDSITLLTAGGSADAPGYWGVTGIVLNQVFPAGQDIGTYNLDLTISVM